ncbi:kinase-like domain-containing protein [Cantharellus anzutake]|uniref:kinase-like domain-containing protein n=1 Tax=Cantharellus anzutake TaxID=1750568 RepID=UPI001904AF2B|nr:kinase-like domain-containing protein [Cantharellus anzutake]KAF8322935.1 kinase-like domain-containing protein [Cantharellus anzutake]
MSSTVISSLKNLLLGLDGKVKIGDFGCSVQANSNCWMTFCGTLNYIAPEMVAGEPCMEKVDHWALSLLMSFLLAMYPSKRIVP